MAGLTTTALAERLGLTKGRISQLVSSGKLDGCYSGDGRNRRFDLGKSAEALQLKLDPGQMLGNGASTKRKLVDLADGGDTEEDQGRQGRDTLSPRDPDRYELARTQKVEEEARRLRRQNAESDGSMVLASAVRQEVVRQVGQEVAQFENVLRDGARAIADRMGIDYRIARQILTETWRKHRGDRAEAKQAEAEGADMTDAERAADF
jgi:ribosomal protein S25